MNRKSVVAVTSGLLVATTLTVAAPTVGAVEDRVSRVVLRDGPGDVWESMPSTEPPLPADRPAADVTRAVVKHGAGFVRVRMRFSDLRRVGWQSYSVVLATPDVFEEYYLRVVARHGSRRGHHRLVDADNARVRCPGLEHVLDYAGDVVRIAIPRRCLGHPRWVRGGLQNWLSFVETDRSFTDNPHNREAWSSEWTRRLYRYEHE